MNDEKTESGNKKRLLEGRAFFVSFASQMFLTIQPTSESKLSNVTVWTEPLESYQVKLKRAQGGCLGTESRRKT